MSRLHYGPLDHFGPEYNDPGTAFIIHNVDDTVTIKVRSPGDRVFSEVEMPLAEWIKLRSVGVDTSVSPAQAAIDFARERKTMDERKQYKNMTTAEKCAAQGDGFINDYD